MRTRKTTMIGVLGRGDSHNMIPRVKFVKASLNGGPVACIARTRRAHYTRKHTIYSCLCCRSSMRLLGLIRRSGKGRSLIPEVLILRWSLGVRTHSGNITSSHRLKLQVTTYTAFNGLLSAAVYPMRLEVLHPAVLARKGVLPWLASERLSLGHPVMHVSVGLDVTYGCMHSSAVCIGLVGASMS